MKTHSLLAALICSAPLATPGAAVELSPTQTVQAFHLAMAKKACVQAQSLMTAQSVAKIEFLIGATFEASCKSGGPFPGKVVKEVLVKEEYKSITGLVTLGVSFVFSDGGQKDETVLLIKECGVWKVIDSF